MKKVFSIMFTIALLGCFSFNANAQSDKKYNKEMDKVYKKSTKELKKQGWIVASTSLTLEAGMMKHIRALKDENNKEMVVEVTMCKSMNVCKSNAENNAASEYARSVGSYIRGRVVSDIFNNASADIPEEFDKFYGAYERLIQAELKGELELSFAVEKPNGKGKTYRAYFIVNEDKAGRARLRAMQRAAEETRLAQQYANQVTDFVRKGFVYENCSITVPGDGN
jgi:hypothetical protein